MTNNFETRLVIYSVILGVIFAYAVYLAIKHNPDNIIRTFCNSRKFVVMIHMF